MEAIKVVNKNQLPIPIYLNQRIVFDLLAILEHGFSQLRTIRSTESHSGSQGKDVGAEIGITNAFALLSIGMKSSRKNDTTSSNQQEVSEERTLTPNALFARLRETLHENKIIKSINLSKADHITQIEIGDFIEFTAQLRMNPLREWMETILQFFNLSKFTDTPAQLQAFLQQSHQQAKQKPQDKSNKKQTDANNLEDALRQLFSNIVQSKTIDLIASTPDSDLKVVVPVEIEFFERQSPAAIIDGQFQVLGKAVQIIPANSDEKVNLLRGTPLAKLPEPIVSQIADSFEKARSVLKMPPLITSITSPVLQIVPIAIYA